MPRLWPLIGCTLVAGLFSLHASAAELNEDAMDAIGRAAKDICGEFLQSGSRSELEISGEANARLKGLIKELVDLGLSGAADFDTEKFVNVAQSDLADELANMRDCRLRIWNDLKDSVINSAAGKPGGNEVAHCDTRAFLCAVPESAFEAGDLLIVQLRLEQFRGNAFLGIMRKSFRAAPRRFLGSRPSPLERFRLDHVVVRRPHGGVGGEEDDHASSVMPHGPTARRRTSPAAARLRHCRQAAFGPHRPPIPPGP